MKNRYVLEDIASWDDLYLDMIAARKYEKPEIGMTKDPKTGLCCLHELYAED